MDSGKIEKRIAKMDPAESKIYYDAKRVLETVEDTESEQFVAAARIVKTFQQRAMRSHKPSESK
jgi:hypothetical protein